MKNSNKLLEILKSHAPDDSSKEKCDILYNKLLLNCTKEYLSTLISKELEKELEKQLAYSLYNGLTFGRWPWV